MRSVFNIPQRLADLESPKDGQLGVSRSIPCEDDVGAQEVAAALSSSLRVLQAGTQTPLCVAEQQELLDQLYIVARYRPHSTFMMTPSHSVTHPRG